MTYKGFCTVCGTDQDDVQHLAIYVTGSEGVNACLDCRLAITESVRGIMRACTRAKKAAYLSAKQTRRKDE